MSRVVLASGNAGKLREIAAILAPRRLELVSQAEFDLPPVVEDAPTFVENALKKARAAAAGTGLAAIADDSGLEVEALHGAPGVRSARYAGEGASDADNVARLLEALHGIDDHRRGARFVCVVVYLRHALDPVPVVCTGTWPGRILAAPRGDNGFGYDPVFAPRGLDTSAAELGAAEKNRVSHRARALAQLDRFLDGSDESA